MRLVPIPRERDPLRRGAPRPAVECLSTTLAIPTPDAPCTQPTYQFLDIGEHLK